MERAPIIIAPVSDDCVRRRCSIFFCAALRADGKGSWWHSGRRLSACLFLPVHARTTQQVSAPMQLTRTNARTPLLAFVVNTSFDGH